MTNFIVEIPDERINDNKVKKELFESGYLCADVKKLKDVTELDVAKTFIGNPYGEIKEIRLGLSKYLENSVLAFTPEEILEVVAMILRSKLETLDKLKSDLDFTNDIDQMSEIEKKMLTLYCNLAQHKWRKK